MTDNFYQLTDNDIAILRCLNESGGLLTRRVANQVPFFGANRHQHSAAVRSWLLRLKKYGLVRLLDNEKPDCWTRTPAGTEALTKVTAA